ncbi:MAG: acylphosphatase [Draconibacterium sp.]|jgi:acylphosphatase
MKQYEITIKGRVQGVGFRYYVYKKATEFGLTGWVKNTTEGNVKAVVQGEESILKTFLEFLLIGPPLARVDKISKYETEVSTVFDKFSVNY